MGTKDTSSKVEEQGQSKLIVSNNQLRNLKSDYSKIFCVYAKKKIIGNSKI